MSSDRWSAHEALAEALEADAAADPDAFGVDAEEALDLAAALSALRGVAAPDDEPVGARRLELEREQIGDYEVVERLGAGGFASVYRARDPVLDVEVAIKLVTVPPGAQAEVQERFEREARTVARLEHRHVVRVRSAGVDGERPFLVMDLVAGDSLQTIVDRDGPLPPLRAAQITRALADALDAAHTAGILHRDVKPDNVLVDAEGEPLLTDFGLALDALAEGNERLTQEGHYLGTPGYWPPEQARGELEAISARSDVYGLGATLYALLTGRPPFVGKSVLATLESMARAFPRPSELADDLTPGLEAICLRCLEDDPAARYPSAAALRDDLDAWLADPSSIPARADRRWGWAPALALGLLVTALVAAAAIDRTRSPGSPAAPAPSSSLPLPAPEPALATGPSSPTAPPPAPTPSEPPGWRAVKPAGSRPRGRVGAALAYDPVGQRSLLFGGLSGREALDDLWSWDGVRWTRLAHSPGPAPRSGAAATYDVARKRFVVAGGRVRRRGRKRRLDLWEHDGATWAEVTLPARLGKRRDPRLVYDVRRRVTVFLSHRHLWEWNGTTWRAGPAAPVARGALAWEPTRGRVLQFDPGSGALWAYDGTRWRVTAHPPPTAHRGFVLTGVAGGVLLSHQAETFWLLREGAWKKVTLPGPSPRTGGALTWDGTRRRVVLFGGLAERRTLAELWELRLP